MSNKPLAKLVAKKKGRDSNEKARQLVAIWPARNGYHGVTLDRDVARVVMKDGTEITADSHFVNLWLDAPLYPKAQQPLDTSREDTLASRLARDDEPPSRPQGGSWPDDPDDSIPFAPREDW